MTYYKIASDGRQAKSRPVACASPLASEGAYAAGYAIDVETNPHCCGTLRGGDGFAMEAERFIADAMLGKLTKWLRVMGVDVVYDPSATDDQLLGCAAQEGRILLSRDRRLLHRRGPTRRLLIESDYYHEQVRQVVQTFGLKPALRVLTRCLRCNAPLHAVAKASIAGRVPPYVYATQMTFKRCLACDRIYWSGTHRENMLRQLQVILEELPSASAQL